MERPYSPTVKKKATGFIEQKIYLLYCSEGLGKNKNVSYVWVGGVLKVWIQRAGSSSWPNDLPPAGNDKYGGRKYGPALNAFKLSIPVQ